MHRPTLASACPAGLDEFWLSLSSALLGAGRNILTKIPAQLSAEVSYFGMVHLHLAHLTCFYIVQFNNDNRDFICRIDGVAKQLRSGADCGNL